MNSLQLHIAGATVSHQSPFSVLEVPSNPDPLPAEIRETWVRPLYFGLRRPDVANILDTHLDQATDELVTRLLANFDWRPRAAAAYIVALTDRTAFTEQIGRLLLRSDVCCVGFAYTLSMAELGSTECVDFLDQYLGYYLGKPNLWFDQAHAMAALAYLDKQNRTEHTLKHIAAWDRFTENKPAWNLQHSVEFFEQHMETLRALKRRA
jgi:hypothetical protein